MSKNDDVIFVDARGLACPEPLMLAKSAIRRAGGKNIQIRVNGGTARDNIARMCSREKISVDERQDGEEIILTLSPAR